MSQYIAKQPDQFGTVDYTEQENETWQILFDRQFKVIQDRACPEFIEGLLTLNMPNDRVPQCNEISERLKKITGWTIEPVPAMISLTEFFNLLANKKFPAATFIRKKEELDYLKEPDIFHEFFGHCPLLTNPAYSDFVNWYGNKALTSPKNIQSLLGRLFWFTIEFGLVKTNKGLRIYGGGILSSCEETVYAIESQKPERVPFDINTILTTHYRYDAIQERYFVLNDLSELYQIQNIDIVGLAAKIADKEHQNKDFNIC